MKLNKKSHSIILFLALINTCQFSFGQIINDFSKIKIDTIYFNEINKDKNTVLSEQFFMMRKTGDGQNFALHCKEGERVFFADPTTMIYQSPKLSNLPTILQSFVPHNYISYPSDNIRLWFSLYWIVITDMKNNYKSHVISPYYTYREIFYGNHTETEEFKLNRNIIFSAHPMKDYDENNIYQKLSPLIPTNTIFAIINLNSILNKNAGDSLTIDDYITTSFCNSSNEIIRALGGSNAGINESTNTIWFSDALMSNLISYSTTTQKYKCYPLPEAQILAAPEWEKSPKLKSKETLSYNGIFSKNPNDSTKSVGLAWQYQWIDLNNSKEILRYWGIGSRSDELTSTLQNQVLLQGNSYTKILNTEDFVIYQYLSLEPTVKILWEVILPGDYYITIKSATKNRIEFYKLIEKNHKTIPALITWEFSR